MGILNSFMQGIGAAGQAAQPYIANMQEAEIQKLRDERLAELAKSGTDYKIQAEEAAAERSRKQIVADMEPNTPSANRFSGILGERMAANLPSSDMQGAEENLGVDVQQRDRPASIADKAQRLLDKGRIKEAGDVSKMDDKDRALEMRMLIEKGKMDTAIQVAQMKGDFGMMLGELRASSAAGNNKATELMRNWEYLSKEKKMSDAEISQKLLEGKIGEYTTVSTESMEGGKKVTRTEKVRAGSHSASPKTTTTPSGQPVGSSPYPEGKRLRGKDGASYTVRNGIPVKD